MIARRSSLVLRHAGVCLAATALGVHILLARPVSPQGTSVSAYTVIGMDARHLLPFRTSGNADLVSLDQVASLFSLVVSEDRLAGGLTIAAHGQRIVLTPGQPLAYIGGRVISLSGAVVRDTNGGWLVPVDLLSRVLGPALNVSIDVRRATRVIAVGAASASNISARLERHGNGVRLTLQADPAVGHQVARDGSHLIVRFDTSAVTLLPLVGAAPDFVSNAHADGASVVLDLGPGVGNVNTTDDGDRLIVDLSAPASAPAPPPPTPAPPAPSSASPPQTAPPPAAAAPALGQLRTIVIDPGHGGDDAGVRSAGGLVEKDLVLDLARRVKSAIETRIGLRVLLTRDGDDAVPLDRRTSLANENKADLFISLHANAAFRPGPRGAEVLTIRPEDYKSGGLHPNGVVDRVPVVGGGTRAIEAVPWDLAQLAFVDQSAAVAATLLRHLTEHNVPLYSRPSDLVPLRVLAGANMPALLLEVGFLTNPDDEKALAGDTVPAALVDAIVDTIADVRRSTTGASTPQRPRP